MITEMKPINGTIRLYARTLGPNTIATKKEIPPTTLNNKQYRPKVHECPNCTCHTQHSQPIMHVLPSSHQNIAPNLLYSPMLSPVKPVPNSNI